jgi:hypothetical protein
MDWKGNAKDYNACGVLVGKPEVDRSLGISIVGGKKILKCISEI